MATKKIVRYTCTCDSPTCGHKWDTRGDKLPVMCPACKSTRWNAGHSFGLGRVRRPEAKVRRGWVMDTSVPIQHYATDGVTLCGVKVNTFNNAPRYRTLPLVAPGCGACIESRLRPLGGK